MRKGEAQNWLISYAELSEIMGRGEWIGNAQNGERKFGDYLAGGKKREGKNICLVWRNKLYGKSGRSAKGKRRNIGRGKGREMGFEMGGKG